MTVSIESWINAKSIEGRSDKTLQYYEDTANRLARFLDRDPKDATSDEIRAFLSSISSAKEAPDGLCW